MKADSCIYLDELSVVTFWKLLRIRSVQKVIVLDVLSKKGKIFLAILRARGVKVKEAEFFLGHHQTSEGESVYQASRRLASGFALEQASILVQSNFELRRINEEYGRGTIQLYVAKYLHPFIESSVAKVLITQSLAGDQRCQLWLKDSGYFDVYCLNDMLRNVETEFYSVFRFKVVKLLWLILFDYLRKIKLFMRGRKQRKQFKEYLFSSKSVVLMLQEDNIRADKSLRGQPHWIDLDFPSNQFDVYILKLVNLFSPILSDIEVLKKAGVYTLPPAAFFEAVKKHKNHGVIRQIRVDGYKAYCAAIFTRNFSSSYFLYKVGGLLGQAGLMASLSLELGTKVFLVRETYYSYSDAMLLVAPKLSIKTIAYQYSNMGFIMPIMMSTADHMLLFSDMYKEIYSARGIVAPNFTSIGYLYDGIPAIVREKALKHRANLEQAGAEFVVCYFDESVQGNRWGLVSKEDHLSELHILAEAVVTDSAFGVVIKSQFMHNSPSKLYPDDELIHRAKATGRYLELAKGAHRNDIYPSEAALVSDLCITHKFGATAGLEAAIVGIRTVLLDSYGVKTLWDSIYSQADIEYESLDDLMKEIVRHRKLLPHEKNQLGDWTCILPYFDSYLDGRAVERLRACVVENVGECG